MTSLKCNLTVNKNPKILKGKIISHRLLFSILENLSLQGKNWKRWHYFYYYAEVFKLNVTYKITRCIAKTSRTKNYYFFSHLLYAWAYEQQNIKKKRKKKVSQLKQALLTWLTLRDDFTKWLRIFEVSSHDSCGIESLGMGEMDAICSDLC